MAMAAMETGTQPAPTTSDRRRVVDRPLRVVWNAVLYDGRASGANRRLTQILRALTAAPEGESVEWILALRPQVEPPVSSPRVRVARVRVPRTPAALRAMREGAELRRVLREARADVWIHESFPLPRTAEVPAVLTVHDLRDLDRAGSGSGWVRRTVAPAIIRESLRRASRIVAVSQTTRRAIEAAEPTVAHRIAVVPNAADHGKPLPRSKPSERARLLFVGHLEARKGADLLPEICFPDAKAAARTLTLVGRGPLERRLRADFAARRVQGSVRFLQDLSEEALAAEYAAADVVLVPSRAEGFGIPALEALAAGAPVLAARIPALEEACGGAARFVSGFEPQAWQSALEALLRDPSARARMCMEGQIWAARFAWRASAVSLLRVLRGAAEERFNRSAQ